MNVGKQTKMFFGVGPYVGFCLKNKIEGDPYFLKGYYPGENAQYYDGYVYGEDQFGNSNQFLYDKARNFDWGLTSNIGVETNNWYMKLQYDLSLGKEGSGDVIGANYHTLTLSVNFDWGLTSNIGVETNNWYMKLQYDLSLGKEGSGDVIGANYHTLTLSVGYKFGL